MKNNNDINASNGGIFTNIKEVRKAGLHVKKRTLAELYIHFLLKKGI